MKSGARIALAVGLGYVIGRRRKLRTALTLAAAVAIGRASQQPGGLLKYGTDLMNASPQLSNLTRLGGPLASAGRAAATAAAGSGIDTLSGKLRGGADALRRRSGAGQQGAAPERSAPDEEQELDEQPAARDDEDRAEAGGRERGR
ncbi:hypothetical protein [Micromonospora eburnea]|uniref:Uncharacterized protein n=1 Tax=Micromonospora eburnea TaxID=227316 RepID=A0A1C6VLF4_9ACTN|nr:hypothetical protein [Micromonospora eburnea]SCL67159.1 hypothetical protein GA0070604_5904 [Micromonospora eburnea]